MRDVAKQVKSVQNKIDRLLKRGFIAVVESVPYKIDRLLEGFSNFINKCLIAIFAFLILLLDSNNSREVSIRDTRLNTYNIERETKRKVTTLLSQVIFEKLRVKGQGEEPEVKTEKQGNRNSIDQFGFDRHNKEQHNSISSYRSQINLFDEFDHKKYKSREKGQRHPKKNATLSSKLPYPLHSGRQVSSSQSNHGRFQLKSKSFHTRKRSSIQRWHKQFPQCDNIETRRVTYNCRGRHIQPGLNSYETKNVKESHLQEEDFLDTFQERKMALSNIQKHDYAYAQSVNGSYLRYTIERAEDCDDEIDLSPVIHNQDSSYLTTAEEEPLNNHVAEADVDEFSITLPYGAIDGLFYLVPASGEPRSFKKI